MSSEVVFEGGNDAEQQQKFMLYLQELYMSLYFSGVTHLQVFLIYLKCNSFVTSAWGLFYCSMLQDIKMTDLPQQRCEVFSEDPGLLACYHIWSFLNQRN